MSTYSQIYIHAVFAVKGRENLLKPEWEERLYRYITGIVTNKGQKMLAIIGAYDHIHFLIGMKPSCCFADLVREVKKASTEFIRNSKFLRFQFQWQEGYGAFSYAHSQLTNVIGYTKNQKEHHENRNFREEYVELLEKFDIKYDEQYLFEFFND